MMMQRCCIVSLPMSRGIQDSRLFRVCTRFAVIGIFHMENFLKMLLTERALNF